MFPKLRFAIAATALALTAGATHAQDFPSDTIRFVVPFAPGNSTDTVARLLAEKMSATLGQTVVVENHGGGGGMIGAAVVAQAVPDGHTVLISTNSIQSAAPFIMKDIPLDPATSFAPVSLLAEISQLVVVPGDSEAQSFQELLDMAKASPGELTYAAPNTISQFAAELLMIRAGVELTAVPYSATAQALNDISTGDIDIGFIGYTTANPYLDAGTIRALATATAEPMPQVPDVPVAADTVPNFYSTAWIAAFVPAGTPDQAITTLNEAFVAALADPAVVSVMEGLAVVPKPTTPEGLGEYVAADIATWKEVTEAANWEAQ